MADPVQAPDTAHELNDDTHATSDALVRRLVKEQLWPQRGRILLTFICMVLVAGASAAMIYLLKDVVDQVLVSRDRTMLYLLPGAIICLALVSGIAGYFEAVNMEVIGHRMVANLQRLMYRGIIWADLQADFAFHQRCGTAALLGRQGPDRADEGFSAGDLSGHHPGRP